MESFKSVGAEETESLCVDNFRRVLQLKEAERWVPPPGLTGSEGVCSKMRVTCSLILGVVSDGVGGGDSYWNDVPEELRGEGDPEQSGRLTLK